MSSKASWSLALLVGASSALVACGGDSGGGDKSGTGGSGSKIDACAIVTQDDAAAIFGNPASPDTGTPVLDANLIGECLWTWDDPLDNQLIQFRVWNGTQYYSAPADSTPYAIGDGGYVRLVAGVDVDWIQSSLTVNLSYSTVGSGIPEATTKEADVKALAQKASTALAK